MIMDMSIFSFKQLEVSLKRDDVFVVISASSNSIDLIKAVEYAKQQGNYTVGLLGFDGGQLMQRKLVGSSSNVCRR